MVSLRSAARIAARSTRPSAPKVLLQSRYTNDAARREINADALANRSIHFRRPEVKLFIGSKNVAELTLVVKTCSFNKSFGKEVKVDSGLDGTYWKTPAGPRIRRAPVRLHNSVV
jgi:hypothetical protein